MSKQSVCDVCGGAAPVGDEQARADGWTGVLVEGPDGLGHLGAWEMDVCPDCAPEVHRAVCSGEYDESPTEP